jgi:hypothetical protein
VLPHLVEIWSAFFDLNSERQNGMGPGPIPSSKIREFAREQMEYEGEEAERFFIIIRRVDSEYLDLNNSSNKPTDAKIEREASVDDAEGMHSIMRSIADRKKKKP